MSPRFALLFDLDGTLADTDPLHLRAFQAVLRRPGLTIDEDLYRRRMAGRPNAVIVAEALPDSPEEERKAVVRAKEDFVRAHLGEVRAVPGAAEFLRWARERGMARALVTTSPRDSVEAVLESIRVAGLLDFLVTGEDVERKKPDPQPYLLALERLGLPPGDVLAFEDSRSGLASARAAGIATVGLLTSRGEAEMMGEGAALIVADFRDEGLRRWILGRLPGGSPGKAP
ncbi:HAD family hydrolase [Roseomonas sp. GCM10028921]